MTARNFGRRLPVALLTALCAFVLTGCVRIEMTFTVDEDGSGTAAVLMAIDESLLALSGESAADLFGDIDEEIDDRPPGAVVDEYRAEGFVGQRMSVPVPDMTDNQLVAGWLGGVDERADVLDDGVGFVREGDGWRFTMAIPPLGQELAGENGDFTAGLAATMLDNAIFRVRVSLPGEIREHNADRIENGVLVWDLDLMGGEPRRLSARSELAGVSPAIVAVAIGAGVAVVVLAAAAARSAVRARRRA